MNGVSEQLLVGKAPHCGSHFNGVVTDKSYQKVWDADEWKPDDPMEEEEDLFREDLFSDWSVHRHRHNGRHTYAQSNVEATQNIQHDLKEQKSAWQQQQQPAWQQQQQPAWQQQLFFKSNEKNK